MDKLNVVYACDDNYAPFACVSICSLLENNQAVFEEITIYVVMDNVSEQNCFKIKSQIEQYNATFIAVDAQIIINQIKSMGIPQYRGSYIANLRMFFDKYILPDVERFVYLDCDTIVCESLKELVEYDFGEDCVLVVQDALTRDYKKLLGFDSNDKYFNTGVLCVDVCNWRKRECSTRLMKHVKEERAAYCNPDQDLLNIVLRDCVRFVGPEYNFQPIHRVLTDKAYNKIYGSTVYYTQQELEFARKRPVILHTYRFMGEFPWHKGNMHPDNDIFDDYLRKSSQKDYVKEEKLLSSIYKIEKMLYVLLPKAFFYRIFKMVQDSSFKRMDKKLKRNSER